jgi:alpha-glucosidase
MWARDAGGVPVKTNLYGTHPVYYEHRAGSGLSHGVLLLNSNGMDININNDNGQYLEYNVIGGVIDLYFMAGPTPFDVAREYSEITRKAAMMPYWGLGFHQCRFGYKSVGEVAEVVANYAKANIPLETMWTGTLCSTREANRCLHSQISTTWTATRSSHLAKGFHSTKCGVLSVTCMGMINITL